MTRPAEFMEVDGIAHSWYCTVCGAELGVDLDERDGMPPAGCVLHGVHRLAWETWSVTTDPTYPHRIILADRYPDLRDEDPQEWCPEHEDWYDDCPCYVSPARGLVYGPGDA